MHAHRKRGPEGIEVRHKKACRSHDAGRCNCKPSYRAVCFDAATGKKLQRTFPDLNEAKSWRRHTQVQLDAGTVGGRATSTETVADAAAALLDGMRNGTIRNRRGEVYKPAAIRSYDAAVRVRLLPELGPRKLSAVRRADVQAFVDKLAREGLSGSTIRNTLDPLRVIFRRAVKRDTLAANPCEGLELPAADGRRDRIATKEEAEALLAALPESQRALWATAFYAGLRRGELRGLRWEDVDLDEHVIRVERGWDDEEGEIEGKSRAARRTVPIVAELRRYLVAHRLATGGTAGTFTFGRTPDDPFTPSTARRHALDAWKDVGLSPIAFHEARHTFASLMIAAGVNAKALSAFMGHASVSMTFDRYGHLMPGSEDEARALMDAYLARTAAG